MDNQDFIYKPAGDQPTTKNLKRNLFTIICITAVICSIIDNLSKPNQEIYALGIFILFTIVEILVFLNGKFIISIRIDANEHKLYANYMKINGKTGITEIDLNRAKVAYNFTRLRASTAWVLTLNDGSSKLRLRETKSRTNKALKNVFLKEQLDEMFHIATQLK